MVLSRAVQTPLWRNALLSRTLGCRHRSTASNSFLRVHDEVREALNAGKPVVALETTIYTHGFPYPDNVALASHLESVVRVNGGIPATIGILDGIARVGMDPEELIQLTASAGKETTLKLSRRDLGFVCGMRLAGKYFNGGTTIAGTMVLAHLAGIKVFATGGLGGVHRGAESSMDISADLTELGRTPVAVISSGCKSFLDIPRTLEYLETEGVGVSTFADGRQGNVDFPAFWSRESGIKSPTVVQDEIEAAAIIYAQNTLPVNSGLIFANPIPEAHSIPKSDMDVIIAEAIKYADAAGAAGKDNTPFILSKIKELSGSKSVTANRALIESNVRRGTIVARELALIEAKARMAETGNTTISVPASPSIAAHPTSKSEAIPSVTPKVSTELYPDIVVAGALAVDFSCDYAPFPGTAASSPAPQVQTSNPAHITQSLGGVGHNIARALHYLHANVSLHSLVGSDFAGRAALSELQRENFNTFGIKEIHDTDTHRTAQYVAVNDAHKDLHLAMADMSILESATPETLPVLWPNITSPSFQPKCLVVDGNWSRDTAHAWLRAGKAVGAITAFEPVSTAKAARFLSTPPSSSNSEPLPTFPHHILDILTPNVHELTALHTAAQESRLLEHPSWFAAIDALGIPPSGLRVALALATSSALVDAGIPQRAVQLLPFAPTILTKLGARGVLLTMMLRRDDPRLASQEAAPYVLSRTGILDEENQVGGLYVRLFEPEEVLGPEDVVSVNGAGDTLLGAVVAGMSKGRAVEDVVGVGMRAAALTMKWRGGVSRNIGGLEV